MVSVPTIQAPVVLLYVPWLGTAPANTKPAGSRSLIRMPLAVFGPRLVTAMANRMASPSSISVLSACLLTDRSADWTWKTAEAELSVRLVSGRFIRVMLAVLVTQLPPEPMFTDPVIASEAAPPGAKAPTSQMPVAAL